MRVADRVRRWWQRPDRVAPPSQEARLHAADAPFSPQEFARASQALDADRRARDRGGIPWVDTIDRLTEAEHRAFERDAAEPHSLLERTMAQQGERTRDDGREGGR